MGVIGNCIMSGRSRYPVPLTYPKDTKSRSSSFYLRVSLEKNEISPVKKKMSSTKRGNRTPQRLIKLSTAEGDGKWNSDYVFSLRQLQLDDLAQDGNNANERVSVNLSIQKHASFGLSVDGNVTLSFTRKCYACASPYRTKIDTNFHVWVLQSSRNGKSCLPEIGGDDPSVIYVKPGCEAELDSFIQDTIRLNASTYEACSELCKKAEPMTLYLSNKDPSSFNKIKRWSKLLELRKAYP